MIRNRYDLMKALTSGGVLRYDHATGKSVIGGEPVAANAVNSVLHGPYSNSRVKMTHCGNDYNEYSFIKA